MKKIRSLLLTAALILAFAGCAVVPTATEPSETAAPTEWVLEETAETKKYDGVKLTFCSMWTESDPAAQVIVQAAEVFEAQTGAVVQIQWLDGDYETISAGADIFQMPGKLLAEKYLDSALDLTEMAEAAGYGAKSYACLTEQVIARCGQLSGIPQTPYVTGIYYNREAFDACGVDTVPGTWEDFLNLCGKLKDGGWEPLTLDSASAGELLTWCLGGKTTTQLLESGGWSKNEQAVQAAQDILDFVKAGYLATGAPGEYPAGQNKIGLSNAVMTVGTNEICGQIEEETCMDLSWGMFPWPGTESAADADVLAVAAGASQPQAAFDFIMLLATGEFDQLRADITGGIPADPGNASPIAGAAEAMLTAAGTADRTAQFSGEQLDVICELWQGKYKDGAAFAEAMDKLD